MDTGTIVFGLVSILLSVFFFVSAKNAESETKKLLTEIKTQVNALQRISNRWMDKTLDYFTQQKPLTLIEQVEAITKITSQTPLLNQAMFQAQTSAPKREDVVSVVIMLYYHVALSNYLAFGYLPRIDEFDESVDFHVSIKNTLNSTATHFRFISAVLDFVPADEITSNPAYPSYQEAQTAFVPFIRDTSEAFIAKQNQ